MSRSRRRNPITGVTAVRSGKQDKKEWHRRFRHGERQRIERDPEALCFSRNHYATQWHLGKDGKVFHRDASPKIFRK